MFLLSIYCIGAFITSCVINWLYEGTFPHDGEIIVALWFILVPVVIFCGLFNILFVLIPSKLYKYISKKIGE